MNDYSCPADRRTPRYFQLHTSGVKQLTPEGIPACCFDLCLLLFGVSTNSTVVSKSFCLLTLEKKKCLFLDKYLGSIHINGSK